MRGTESYWTSITLRVPNPAVEGQNASERLVKTHLLHYPRLCGGHDAFRHSTSLSTRTRSITAMKRRYSKTRSAAHSTAKSSAAAAEEKPPKAAANEGASIPSTALQRSKKRQIDLEPEASQLSAKRTRVSKSNTQRSAVEDEIPTASIKVETPVPDLVQLLMVDF